MNDRFSLLPQVSSRRQLAAASRLRKCGEEPLPARTEDLLRPSRDDKNVHAWRGCLASLAILLPLLIASPVLADNDTNLARAKGTVPLGSGSNGPFTIHKINDGRTDPLGMWSSGGEAGAFAGVQLGETPVTFNTVRFYLYNGRSAFTGWRLEGSNDCQIDEDSYLASFYDPQSIATDANGPFANCKTKENNVVTVTFQPVSYKYVRLVLPNKSARVGVAELEVFNRDDNVTPQAGVSAIHGGQAIAVDDLKSTIAFAGPASVSQVVGKLTKLQANTLDAYDSSGKKLAETDALKSQCFLLARQSAGGGDLPSRTQYRCYSILDSNSPPPAAGPYTPSTRPALPPKPSMTPVAAPEAPAGTVNLVEGKTITASINARGAADLAKPGDANWFAQQRYPQWFCIDLGAPAEFDYVSIKVLGPLSLQHFWVQTSDDASHWANLVEVDHVRKNTLWNGYFEKQKARYVRAILTPPSSDVHVKKFVVADLAKPLAATDGQPVPVLKPESMNVADFSGLPAAAAVDASPR